MGINGNGTVYKMNTDGTNFTVLYSLSGRINGDSGPKRD